MAYRKKTLAYIRQLCSIGLGAESIMPSLLIAIRDAIPCRGAAFFFLDERFDITNVYIDDIQSIKILSVYLTEYMNKLEVPEWGGFSEYVRTHRSISDRRSEISPSFYNSSLYNECFFPIRIGPPLMVPIYENEQCLGVLDLFREPRDIPFSSSEKRQLSFIAPYIAHAFTSKQRMNNCYDDTEETGLVVCNKIGEVQYCCPEGRRLMYLAFFPVINERSMKRCFDYVIKQKLLELTSRVVKIFSGQSAEAPVLHRTNYWGRFVFRGYWLDENKNHDSLIGLYIKRQVPRQLKIMSTIHNSNLSWRQREIALLIAEGLSTSQIAKQLGVTNNTAIYHIRRAYEKLDAHTRKDFVERLTSQQRDFH